MNKKLIKKYKNEFDHWINDGELLIGYKNKDGSIDWSILSENNWDFSADNHMIIIRDEYTIFRRALAEGKIVQYQTRLTNGDDWLDMGYDGCNPFGRSDYTNIRIKPEEQQQLKIGDFVRYKNIQNGKAMMINNINCGYYYMKNSEEAFKEHELIEWEPIVNELCWFINNKDSKSAVLCKFDSYEKDKIVFKFKNIRKKSFVYCEPFLNSKPSWFKD